MNIPSAGGPDIDTDGTLAANSDTLVASQKAVKTYADALIAANDAMVFKGVIDCSSNPNYPAADRGHQYRASVAGKIGGASGINVEVGDMILCLTDGTISGNQATVGTNWAIIQTNLDGALLITDIGVTVQGYDADLQSYGAAADAAARRDLIGATSGVWQASAGGTGNAFFAVTGPTTSTKTYTLRNASTNIVTAPSALVTDRVPYINSNGELISNSSLTYSAGLFSVDGSPGYRCTYGGLWMGVLDVGATGNAGRLIIGTAAGSTSDIVLRGSTQENVFNETGKDQDFRIESDTVANFFIVDAGVFTGAGGVSIGAVHTGTYKLELTGTFGLSDQLFFTVVAKGITYKSGTGQRAGNATLVGGTVTVTNTSVTANTIAIISRKTAGGTLGNLTYTLSNGASFTINSDNALDTSVVSYELVEVV